MARNCPQIWPSMANKVRNSSSVFSKVIFQSVDGGRHHGIVSNKFSGYRILSV